MEQLSGLDASFLYLETPATPMHVGGLQIYDPSTAPGGEVTFDQLLLWVERHLAMSRTLRQKLVTVPFNLDHPYWVEDANFDLEFHIRELGLPKPGDWHQLTTQVARLMGRGLDLTRPLWEMYVVRGLDAIPGVPRGSIGLVTKVHHAAIDGVSGVELTALLNHLDASGDPPPAATTPFTGEADPDPMRLVANATRNNLVRPMHFARVVGRTVPGVGRAVQGVRQNQMGAPPVPGGMPRTRFNGPVDPHRVFDGVSLPFSAFKTIRQAVPGATVNDAVLTIVGGALRRYLSALDELPEAAVIAMAPISTRSTDLLGTQGNQVSMMLVSLATNVAKPLDRLRTVYASTVSSKELAKAVGAKTLTDYSEFIPAAVAGLAARLYTRNGLANRHNPIFNTVVTNIPGPQVPLYCCGAKMVAYYGLGPIFDGMGLIHPVLSYDGRLTISFTSAREMIPEPEVYASCLQESFDELLRAAKRAVKSAS